MANADFGSLLMAAVVMTAMVCWWPVRCWLAAGDGTRGGALGAWGAGVPTCARAALLWPRCPAGRSLPTEAHS
eukprot:10981008-Alexandrium_andersonii.AAC.1